MQAALNDPFLPRRHARLLFDERRCSVMDLGRSGPAMTICVGCHKDTGIDAGHSGHDFVYTQVK